jgi:hypothetical protein
MMIICWVLSFLLPPVAGGAAFAACNILKGSVTGAG